MTFALTIEALTLHDPAGRVLVDIPALSLPAGGALGIAGASGAGKSTLLMALAGLATGAAGQIRWGETSLLALSAAERARFRAANIGLVFQDFMLFEELGALGNAGLAALYAPRARRAGIRQMAEAELATLGLGSAAAQSVTTLSGGERQRVALARALANVPGILLADEPTANLDRERAQALITDLMARVRAQGITLITVSHDPSLLAAMDRCVTLRDGALVPA